MFEVFHVFTVEKKCFYFVLLQTWPTLHTEDGGVPAVDNHLPAGHLPLFALPMHTAPGSESWYCSVCTHLHSFTWLLFWWCLQQEVQPTPADHPPTHTHPSSPPASFSVLPPQIMILLCNQQSFICTDNNGACQGE